MNVAVIGATGMLGQPVTNELLQAGFSVRIIARDVEKTRRLFLGAAVVAGDLRDVQGLTTALRGIDIVYCNLSIKQTEKEADFHTETDGLANLIQAAQTAGVGRVSYLASMVMRYQGMNGFRWWAFDIKQQAVQLIKLSGLPYSIFYPSCFMESMNGSQRAGKFVLLIGRSSVRPMFIAAHDYGKQVARAFHIAQDRQNQEYIIQSPEAITQHQAAERFVSAHKKETLRILTISPIFPQFGRLFAPKADYGWHITEAINNYPEVFEASQTWADLGTPETTVDQFASQL